MVRSGVYFSCIHVHERQMIRKYICMLLHAWLGYSNCRPTSRPPPPSRVPFSPALSVEFTTENINEVNESPVVCRTRFTKCFHGVGAIYC